MLNLLPRILLQPVADLCVAVAEPILPPGVCPRDPFVLLVQIQAFLVRDDDRSLSQLSVSVHRCWLIVSAVRGHVC